MSLAWVRRYYKLPFIKRGMKVRFQGSEATITAAPDQYLNLRLLHGDKAKVVRVHPTWQMEYFDAAGKTLAKFED